MRYLIPYMFMSPMEFGWRNRYLWCEMVFRSMNLNIFEIKNKQYFVPAIRVWHTSVVTCLQNGSIRIVMGFRPLGTWGKDIHYFFDPTIRTFTNVYCSSLFFFMPSYKITPHSKKKMSRFILDSDSFNSTSINLVTVILLYI